MANDLVALDLAQLPATQAGDDADFAAFSGGGSFLSRLQLYTKGKAIDKALIPPGHYGIPETGEEITDLGESINVLALARRTKALDLTDTDSPISVYDRKSEEFIRIEAASKGKDSHCMVGASYLLFEKSTGRFLEFFCSSKSAQTEEKNMKPFLPVTQADIDRKKAAKADVSNMEPHGPIPFTLKTRYVEKGSWSWHAPVAVRSSVPFPNLPPTAELVSQITAFLNPKAADVEVVTEAEKTKTQRRKR